MRHFTPLRSKINTLYSKIVSVFVYRLASRKWLFIHCSNNKVVKKLLRSFANAKTFQEEIYDGIWSWPRLVKRGYNDCFVGHGRILQDVSQDSSLLLYLINKTPLINFYVLQTERYQIEQCLPEEIETNHWTFHRQNKIFWYITGRLIIYIHYRKI